MKRDLKLLISLVFYACCRVKNCFLLLLGRKAEGRFVILYYHAVPDAQRPVFAKQMDTLIEQSTPMPVDWRGKVPEGKLFTAVTFDDGFESVARNALPELAARKISSTHFIPSGYLGKAPAWDMAENHPDRKEKVMDASALKAIASSEVTLASHTVSHPRLTGLTSDEMRRELFESKKSLEAALELPITLFSFPHGACNAELIDLAREAGYERVYTITPSLALLKEDEYITGRVSIALDDRPLEFFLKLHGMYSWLPALSMLKRKLFGPVKQSSPSMDTTREVDLPFPQIKEKRST